jgi:hypothetical protein
MAHELRYRQVHLDFHTSEHIGGIGADFDPEKFATTLKRAHVDSVTLFSRCHHGWIYHDTRFPYRHPHLETNLMAQQIRACHAADIKCPIYITVGWDELQARLHPEWREVAADGRPAGAAPLEAGWKKLCFGSPYVDYVVEQTEEVLDIFGDEVDGLFFDIIFVSGAHSVWALAEYERQGLDPANEDDVRKMKNWLIHRYMSRVTDAVRAKNPRVPIFHNSGHVSPEFRPRLQYFSHLEVESLPTGGWGYNHLPLAARYTRTLHPEWLGMTGKFSETWGHFNSYKNPAALEFECFSALALGGKCSVGDQLPPCGQLDAATYDLIGGVYRQVEEREPWCKGAVPAVDIAVINAEVIPGAGDRANNAINIGVMRALAETQHQFDFVDFETDLSSYRLLILPDNIELSPAQIQKVDAFVANGGKVLATGNSGFGMAGFPAENLGTRAFSPDFAQLAGDDQAVVMYEPAIKVAATNNAEVVAEIFDPYFNRTYQHFCSHAHAPLEKLSGDPAALLTSSIGYLAHPVFQTYATHSMTWHRDLITRMINSLLPDPLVKLDGPRSIQAHVQTRGDETLVHLMHYIPERRGLRYDIVEDALSLAGATLRVRGQFTSGAFQPQGIPAEITQEGGYAVVPLPAISGHTILELK